jgi:hypothetical protein
MFCAVVLGVVCSVGAGGNKDQNVLKLPGGTVIAPDGYVWKKVHQERMGGKTMVMYGAASKESNATLVLGIVPQTAENDDARIDTVKSYFETSVMSLKKAGVKDLKATPPDLRPPLADKVEFSISFTNKRDEACVLSGRVFFTKKIYLIEAFAGNNQEAEALVRVTDALSE